MQSAQVSRPDVLLGPFSVPSPSPARLAFSAPEEAPANVRWASRKPGPRWGLLPGDGADGPGGVVDLSLELYVATQRRNYEALPEAAVPPRTGAPAPSGTSGYISTPSLGPADYAYASARLMCSTDGLALVRVTGEIDLYTAPKLLAAVNEALADGPAQSSSTSPKCPCSLPRGPWRCLSPGGSASAEVRSSWSSVPRPPP